MPVNKKKIYQVNDFVFVNADRGKTPGIASVIKVDQEEAEIRFEANGKTETFYFAHLHQTFECHFKKRKFLEDRAAKVGASKR